jgi:hypothetical protein
MKEFYSGERIVPKNLFIIKQMSSRSCGSLLNKFGRSVVQVNVNPLL